jgi:hypothetical protein
MVPATDTFTRNINQMLSLSLTVILLRLSMARVAPQMMVCSSTLCLSASRYQQQAGQLAQLRLHGMRHGSCWLQQGAGRCATVSGFT